MEHSTWSRNVGRGLLALACSLSAAPGCGSDPSSASPTDDLADAESADSSPELDSKQEQADSQSPHPDSAASSDAKADSSKPEAGSDASSPHDGAAEASQAETGAPETGSDSSAASSVLTPSSGGDNQDPINAALSKGGVVHLKAGTYTISDTIVMTSGSTLEGEPGTKIVLVGNAGWPKYQAIVEGHSVSGVHITGLEIDGNGPENTTSNGASCVCGKYYYTMLYFTDSSGIEVDHLYLHDNWNDILKFSHCSDVSFHDNTVRKEGHDVVYAIHSQDVQVYNNDIKIACNSGVRPDSTTGIYIYGNIIGRDGGGYAGIEIQGDSEVWACDNDIHGLLGPEIANLSGAPVHTSGCPTAPPADYPPATILPGL